jgi:mono/diheme cytochrome c family protein
MKITITFLLMATLAASALGASLSPESQRQYEQIVQPFLETHCYDCHDEQKTRAGFRIDTLGTDFLADKTADNWKEIYDNIGLGKMPPAKKPRPDEAETRAVTDWIDQEIRNAERLAKNSPARTRRLNRTEYFNTLRDLFHLDENYVRSLTDELPPDGKVDGFDRVGASLYIDQSQLAKYFELADRVLNERILTPQPKATVPVKDLAKDMQFRAETDGGKLTVLKPTERFGTIFLGPAGYNKSLATLPPGAKVFEMKNGGIEYLAGTRATPLGSHGSYAHTGAGAGGGYWASRVYGFLSKITQQGTYRLKLRAGAFAGKGKYAVENVKVQFEFGKDSGSMDRASMVIDAPLDQPKDFAVDVYLHPRPEVAAGNRVNLFWNGVPSGSQAMIDGKLVQTGLVVRAPELWKLEDDCVSEYQRTPYVEGKKGTPQQRINELMTAQIPVAVEKHDQIIAKMVRDSTAVFSYNPDFDLESIPRLFIESLEVEGPIVEWPPRARKELFVGGEERAIDSTYLREIFASFLPRAYRRTVEPEEVDDWVTWVLKAQAAFQLSGLDAVREGVKAVLCSPAFLFVRQVAGDVNRPQLLTDYELVSRLSYFLWSTMPDDELFSLAAANKLHDPKTLEAQVRRMIADPKGMGLIQDFTGQWLQVRDFYKTNTDRYQYKAYTDELQKSEWQEPYEFFREVLRGDLSIINFLDSNFVVIDKQLAEYYEMAGVKEADGFKKLATTPEQHRGGILGMAGVLTYLTDGLRTLPVRRAAYVKEVMWNEPAKPPPPNVGDLPAIKGKNLTVRQRLEQHRNSASCASCHARLDPFGMALENYDAIGKWRDRQNGEGMRGDDKSPPLDVSGTLPSGREFHDLTEYKQALLAEKDHFVRGFTKKMLTYALGRSVGAVDRELVDSVVGTLEQNDYRMQTLLQAIVASEAFRSK